MPIRPPFVVRHVEHVVLCVRDVAAIQKFYCDVPGCSMAAR